MRPIVVSLDMLKVGRVLESRIGPVKLPHPPDEQSILG